MLLELQVQDFALIEKLKVTFDIGLNILTGETGAGKSIIIDSVNFVLGERTSKDAIRTGAERTDVQAVFDINEDSELSNLLNDYGLEADDGIIVLSRELNVSGRSISRINGKVVTAAVLKSISNYLIDIHGQHEHQSLLNQDYHIEILDIFGGAQLNTLKGEVKNDYLEVQDIKRQLKSITGDDIERERKLNLLDYQINEIDSARLNTGEEEDLLRERTILNNAGRIFSVLSSSYSNLYESEDENQSVYDRLGYILSEFRAISGIDNKLEVINKSIEEVYYNLESVTEDIRAYRDKIDFNPDRINDIESRLELISSLKRKYGKTITDILDYREKVYKEKQDIVNSEETIKKLKQKFNEKMDILDKKVRQLSGIRKKVASKLESSILEELKFLGMEKSKFEIRFDILTKDGKQDYSEDGIDIVSFLISTNPGEPVKPLSKIASGGEISRIMLAIKTVMADTDKIPSLIFDEIDTGISGKAAQAVAEKMGQISKTHQIICVTHLPQIASMADTHFCITKSFISGKTITNVEKLDFDSKTKEVARMLGGARLTDLTLKHAEEMINIAQSIKKSY